jgi:hypothetical protein
MSHLCVRDDVKQNNLNSGIEKYILSAEQIRPEYKRLKLFTENVTQFSSNLMYYKKKKS